MSMDELQILTILSNGQRHSVNELIKGCRITGIELMMIAQGMKQKGWIELTREAPEPAKMSWKNQPPLTLLRATILTRPRSIFR